MARWSPAVPMRHCAIWGAFPSKTNRAWSWSMSVHRSMLMSLYTIILTDFGEPDWDLELQVLHASGLDLNLIRLQTKAPEQLIPQVATADALIVQWANINGKVIEAMRHCKVISRYGIGVDMIDLAAASERGIIVANVHDYCIEEVSTQTIGFIIALNRHIVRMNDHVRAGRWGVAPAPYGPPHRLNGQTLGIIGLGNIGRVVAQKAGCLGLKLLAYDPYSNRESLAGLGVELVGLEELLRRSDYVSIHCPLVEETRKLIGATQLAMMKPDAYLINMARGACAGPALPPDGSQHARSGCRSAGGSSLSPRSPQHPLRRVRLG